MQAEIGLFFIDSFTIFMDIMLFLIVIFIFGGFVEYVLKDIFKVHRRYQSIPSLIILNIRVILGISLILVFSSIASFFHILNQFFILSATVITSVGYFLMVVKNRNAHDFKWNHNLLNISVVIALLICGSMLRLVTLSLNGIVFPGDDVKFHSLLTELIRLNNGFSETLEPFIHQAVGYPPGFHMVVCFFSTMIGQLPTKTLTIFVCFAYGLVGLGIYSLAYALSRSGIASFVSSLSFLFINSQISFITNWGGVTLLVAFFFTSTFLALIYFDKNAYPDKFFKCIAGIAFVVALITNTGLALIGLVLLAPLILRRILSKPLCVHEIKISFKSEVSPFLISSLIFFLLMTPLVLPTIKLALGLVPTDLIAPETPTDILLYGADWYSVENFVPRLVFEHGIFMTVSLMVSVPIFILLFYMYFIAKDQRFKEFWFSYSSIFSWILILLAFGINNPRSLFFIEFPLWNLFTPARMFTFLLLPLCILSGLLFQSMLIGIRQIRTYIDNQKYAKYLGYFFLAIFVAFLISACYFDYRTNQSWELLARNRIPISNDDLCCFEWIKENTSINDSFLVETIDAGQYIPSFCDRITIYPFTGMQYDLDYVKLKSEINTDPDGIQALNLLNELGIQYVFIGSKIDWWRAGNATTFDVDLLLVSSHYRLVFNSGESYIFKVELDSGNDN